MPVRERKNREIEVEPLRAQVRRGRRGAKNQFMPQNRWAALTGALIIIFAAVGVYFVGSTVYRFAVERAHSATQAELDRYAEKIKPLTMFDPPTFESPQKLDNELMLKVSVWLALSRLENPRYDELGAVLLPGSEVRAAAAELFGPGVFPELTGFQLSGASVDYEPIGAAY
ncbi:MAG: hypothetical protein LBQ48_06915, partial [Oscillospiraceae bacterium]|nr:hypothetical protein [Oscillospiraceae bacterium]